MSDAKEIIHGPNSAIQEAILASWVDEVGMFGEKGWGKSECMLNLPLYYVNEERHNSLFLRRTSTDFEDLWNRACLFYRGLNPEINYAKHTITFSKGARVKFGHCQHAKDVLIYDGQEYQLLAVDELMQFASFMYAKLMSSVRGGGVNSLKQIYSSGNPFGEGLKMVKNRFYDKLRPTTQNDDGTLVPGEIGLFTNINGKDTRASQQLEDRFWNLRAKYPDEWRIRKAEDSEMNIWLSREWYFGRRKFNKDLDPGYEGVLAQLSGKERSAYMYGLFENFDDEYQLIKSDWWDKAKSGTVEKIPGGPAFGYDYAGPGNDNNVLVIGDHNQVRSFEEWEYKRQEDIAAQLAGLFDRHGRYRLIGAVDANGPGSGVYEVLTGEGYKLGDRITPLTEKSQSFKNQSAYKSTMKFNNLRSQIWYKFMRDMERGTVDLSVIAGAYAEGYYDNFYLLEEEVLAMRAVVRGGVYKVIPKSELKQAQLSKEWGGGTGLKRSPDRADALVYWWWIHDKHNDIKEVMGLDPVDSYEADESFETEMDGGAWT